MITVAICTYNRLNGLRQALEDLARMQPPDGHDVEILVVDNNSSDGTAEALRDCASCGPYPLRYAFESRQGLSYALNRAIVEACGQWIAFTADDVRIDPGWLASLARGARLSGADVSVGRVVLTWPPRLPAWVDPEAPPHQRAIFLNYELSGGSRLLAPSDLGEPHGNNTLFRKELFSRYGLFRTDLGYCGGKPMGGEDTEMLARLRSAGVPVYYAHDAVIYHPIEPSRISLRFLARRQFWTGYGQAGQQMEEPSARRIFGVPLYEYRRLGRCIYTCLGFMLRRRYPPAAHHLGVTCSQLGYMRGLMSLRKRAHAPMRAEAR